LTATLAGKTLSLQDVQILPEFHLNEWDGWKSSAYKRSCRPLGLQRIYQIACLEKDVSWTNSAAKAFLTQMTVDSSVLLWISEGDKLTIDSAQVRILSCPVSMPQIGNQNVRFFTVTVREDP